LRRSGHWTEKTHGGLYSSGLPDLLVFLHKDTCAVPLILAVEAKVVHGVRTTVELFDSLRGSVKTPSRQRAVGWELAKRGTPAGILALDKADDKAVFAFFWEAIAAPIAAPRRWSVDDMGDEFVRYAMSKYGCDYVNGPSWGQYFPFKGPPVPPSAPT
jgi:hypothetical protein